MDRSDKQRIEGIVQRILDDFGDDRAINKTDLCNEPDKTAIIDVIDKLMKILYPGYYSDKLYKIYSLKNNMSVIIEDVIFHLKKQIMIVLRYCKKFPELTDAELEDKAMDITYEFMDKIPQIRDYLETDIQAAFDGDPAAGSKDEVILSYPGLYAISVYRMAHELCLLDVPMIPRIMTEHAHSVTGIDIHPGATIGKYFFIDHGTGIVIGETTIIGEHVKIYQGVTLGAKSFAVQPDGTLVKGRKRHPDIGSNVVIYAGATILGGDTKIGDGCVIGGNVWLTHSVEPGKRVLTAREQTEFVTTDI